MKISSDVNTIFAYGDKNHILHKNVCLHMIKNNKKNYVLLSKVKSHFIYTYKDYLTDCCIVLEKSIREEKERRSKSPSKTYQPSLFAISASVRKLINDFIKEKAKNQNFNSNAAKNFISLLLTDYSIPELYKNKDSFAEFREKYLVQAEERALEILNKFLKFYRKFELMNIEQYVSFKDWFNKIKDSNKNVFKNKKDYEDMNIAAELLSFNQDISILDFFTCDKDFYYSLKNIVVEYSQKIGQVHLIRR